jgi:hypothetical protein
MNPKTKTFLSTDLLPADTHPGLLDWLKSALDLCQNCGSMPDLLPALQPYELRKLKEVTFCFQGKDAFKADSPNARSRNRCFEGKPTITCALKSGARDNELRDFVSDILSHIEILIQNFPLRGKQEKLPIAKDPPPSELIRDVVERGN